MAHLTACRPEVAIPALEGRTHIALLGFRTEVPPPLVRSPCALAWSSGPLSAADFPVTAPSELEP